jgi:hypothetical protein
MADTLDIITLQAGVTAALGVDGGNHDEAIAQAITAISRRIDDLCGPVVARAVTEYHDGGGCSIVPRRTPVDSVTTLKEYDGSSTTTLTADSFGTVNADGYRLQQRDYAHECEILRTDLGEVAYFPTGFDCVELVYSAGRYATTAAVDERFQVACQSILRRMWDREAGAWGRAADPFEEGLAPSSRFFNAVDHIVNEQLGKDKRPPATG